MKKEVLERVKDAFLRFPTVDRLWVSAKGEIVFDSTREPMMKMVLRSEINNEENRGE